MRIKGNVIGGKNKGEKIGFPTIINTKNATQVLKDGDEIEMNLKTGEIEVLKHK
ncbi:MAG: hypothetical protein ACD_11C00065G0004 [uncultured bacterium]|nr:MAG: hypothetical protein ACD_11C00065G0004 [uncultured bacterium]